MPSILPRLRFAVKDKLCNQLRRCRLATVRIRYLIIINLLNGRSAYQTAKVLHGHNTTVYRVARRFRNQGEWALYDAREDNGPTKLDDNYLTVLHVSSVKEDNDVAIKAQRRNYPRVASFIRHVAQRLHAGTEFDLYVRAGRAAGRRFIARRLFAGELRDVGTGTPAPGIRWGISLEHVAMRNDAAGQTPPTFTLLPRRQAQDRFDFECRQAGPRLAGPIRVQC